MNAEQLLTEMRDCIDTTKVSAADFSELVIASLFYANKHAARDAVRLAMEEVLTNNDIVAIATPEYLAECELAYCAPTVGQANGQ